MLPENQAKVIGAFSIMMLTSQQEANDSENDDDYKAPDSGSMNSSWALWKATEAAADRRNSRQVPTEGTADMCQN